MNLLPHFQTDRSLRELTTFGIGGRARFFVEVHTKEELQQAFSICQQQSISYFILGKGSNSLFDDQGFNGLVIANRIQFCERLSEETFYVGAGYSFSLLGSQTARQGLSGLEFASGIPASVGGAVYMNAGANGRETCECLVSVDFVTEQGELLSLPKSAIEFGYRFSSFQKMPGAIIGATFCLISSSCARSKQLELFNYRKKTQPYNAKSAGCVFRNPPSYHAGALIEQCGLKGVSIGGASVSDRHANFVINRNNASCQEVLALLSLIKEKVKIETGIDLECEVRHIPYQMKTPTINDYERIPS